MCGSDGKEFACKAGGPGSIPGSGRSPGVRNGYPLQYSCLEHSLDREAWGATVHGVTKSWTWLSDWYHLFAFLPQNLLGFLSTPSPLFLVKSYVSCSCLANFSGFQLFSAYHILLWWYEPLSGCSPVWGYLQIWSLHNFYFILFLGKNYAIEQPNKAIPALPSI